MRFYKMYQLDRSGGIKGTRLIQAADDADALLKAKSESRGADYEVWDLTRLIGQSWAKGQADPAALSAALGSRAAA